MKKPVLLSLSGAALFAAGYLVRDRMDGSPDQAQNTNPVASAAKERTASSHSAQPAKNTANSALRPFVPGRPFAKGQAREWLSGLVSEFGGNRRGDFVTLMNLQPLFLTMDGESVQEAMAAALEMSAIEDTKNPARRRNPNGDGKLDTLIMLAMMRMAQTDPEQAMEALKKNFNHNDGTTRALVFGRLAADDPQRAEQLALSLDKDHRHEGLEAVMYALSLTKIPRPRSTSQRVMPEPWIPGTAGRSSKAGPTVIRKPPWPPPCRKWPNPEIRNSSAIPSKSGAKKIWPPPQSGPPPMKAPAASSPVPWSSSGASKMTRRQP